MQPAFRPLVDDEELVRQALEADPNISLDDAVPFASVAMDPLSDALPEWYMPTPMLRHQRVRGWRRHAIVLVIASFIAIDAYGLCNTYGDLTPRDVHVRIHAGGVR